MKTALRLTIAAFGLAALNLSAASVIQFSAWTYNVTEGVNAQAEVVVQRTNDLDTVVSVDFATTNASATAGLDYLDVATNLTFGAGETNKLVTVPIHNDGLVEVGETFQVMLSSPTGGAVLGNRTNATVVITDNDKGLAFEFASYQAREDEAAVLIGVVRGDDGDFPVTVDFATADGTALAGQDYTATNGMLGFAAGERLKLVTIPILNDGLKEPPKTFRFYLTNATGVVLGNPRTATVTIVDNDPGVQFEYNKLWIRENEGLLTVKVLRGNDVDLPPFAVDYATSNLTAVAGEDYTETKGTLAFAAGEPFKMLGVPILWNQTSELDRQFKLTLSNPSAGVVLGANKAATVVVLDMTAMAAHRFDGLAILPDQSVQLILGGGVHKRFKDYFDLYPIEVSSNLVDWTPLVTVQRTNSSTNTLVYTDPDGMNADQRFYRTVTNHLITPLRQPTGPLPVGVISRLVSDPTRHNRYLVSSNSCFVVSIWYPAVQEGRAVLGRMEDEPLARDPAWQGAFIDRAPSFVSHALPGARWATDRGSYPVVIYSPGGWGTRTEIVERGPDLASHGYVVVAADGTDVFATTFPDGTYLKGDSNLGVTGAGFQDRIQDLRFILDQLGKWNQTDPDFANRLDLNNVATMGFSWGGGVAREMARIDERCKATIVLEGYFQNTPNLSLPKPSISIYAQPINLPGSEYLLFNLATHDAIWMQITATVHSDFCDYYWYYNRPASVREAVRTINAYTLWFLNKYLKGSTDPMPALADYPRIINFKQK